jgi:hypothetical protein
VSERCEGCGSSRIAGHTLDGVALCPRCAPVQPAPDGERVAEYERLTRAQLETCLLGLLARVAEESTGAAVRFAPLERGVTDVMELFDHAAPSDALDGREQAVSGSAFCELMGPNCRVMLRRDEVARGACDNCIADRAAAEPTAAPEQPKVSADLVADLRYGAEGDGYPLSSEQCAALLRAIGEGV